MRQAITYASCMPCQGLCSQLPGHVQARRGLTGIMNYTNPGAISHNEIMELYKQYIDSEFSWANFTIEEQSKVIKAPRSNNLLDTARVRTCHVHLPWIAQHASISSAQVSGAYTA